ncbi:MAG TPA: efflux RND transporter periplasmic adaptor subunit [Chthoniobacteraceae bacterium]|jgi:putative peptide zinc metalloprotease protein|nr:efflux RND transporter periplasmic adaptor subunit [Chthoniobacteraceae bacterium]
MAAVATHPEPVSAPPPPQQENVVMPALRGDLIVTQQFFEGRSYYVVKDPISLQYFRMTAEDYFLATLFDGRRTFGKIRDAYVERHPHVLLDYSTEELNERVLRFANDLALLQFLTVQGQRLKARYDAVREKKAKKAFLYNLANRVFFFRFSLYDPDRLFTRMARPLWWMWTKATLWISIVLIVLAAIVFLRNYNHLAAALGNLFSFQNVLLMWVTTFVIKSIHELGHGLTCKHFGGEVHEIGVMALVFTPYFFVNVSDSWVMPNRMHRMLVSAAGIYVELIFAAFATFFWAIVQPGLLKDFLFNIIFIASVSTIIFNANPLMRFDGYYIMTDLIEVPNLQAKSRALIQHQFNRLLFGSSNKEGVLARLPLPKKRFWLFYTYAVLSWIYGYYVIYSLAIFMGPHLKPFGLEGLANWFTALALTSWVVMPLIAFFKGLDLKKEDWKPQGRLQRLIKVTMVSIGIFGAACFLPVELTIKRAGAVHLAEPDEIRTQVPGFIEEIFVKEGEIVEPGAKVARLSNRETEQMLAATEGRFKMAEAEVQRAVGLDKPADLKQAQAVRSAFEAKLQDARRDVENLTLRAKTGGVVLTRDLQTKVGLLLKSNDVLCEIGRLDPMRIKVALSEKEVRYVKRGQRVELKTQAYPGRTIRGVIAEDPIMFFAGELPKAFSSQRLGDVPTYIDAHGRELPVSRTFEAVVEVENPEGLIRPGMTARGKIYAGKRPWGQLVLQSMLDLISLDYRF